MRCAVLGPATSLALGATTLADGLPAVIAFDCEESSSIGRQFRVLQPGPDANRHGQVVFADANGVYRYDAATGETTVCAELGDRPTCVDGTRGDWLVSFGPHVRINDSGHAAWIGETRADCPDDLGPTRVCFQSDPVDACSSQDDELAVYRWDGATTTRVSCCPLAEVLGHDFAIDGDSRVAFVSREPDACEPGERTERLVLADGDSTLFLYSRGDVLPSGRVLACCGSDPVFGGLGARRSGGATVFHARTDPPALAGGGACCRPDLVAESGATLIECGERTFDGRVIVPRCDTKPVFGRMSIGLCPLGPCRAAIATIDEAGCDEGGPVEAILQMDFENGWHGVAVETGRPYDGLGGRIFCDLASDVAGAPGVVDAPAPGNSRSAFAGHYGTAACCAAGGSIPAIFVHSGRPRRTVLVEAGDRAPWPHDDRRYVAFGPPVLVVGDETDHVVFWALTTGHDERELGGIFAVAVPPALCSADLSRNGVVEIRDLLEVLETWDETCAPADLDASGIVDVGDVLPILRSWGPCPP